jgi:hypothetical protein
MYNSAANQLTEMVPLERIERELGRAARNGATEYLLINTSDIRPYVLTTRAAMELAWKPASYAPAAFLDKWCREEFGPRAATQAAEYYRAYFAAPGRYGKLEHQTLADNAYHTFARHLLVEMISGKGAAPSRNFPGVTDFAQYARLMAQAALEAEPRWKAARDAALKTSRLVPAARRPFFQSHVLMQLAIHEHSNRGLRLAAEAYLDARERKPKIASAIQELGEVLAALQAAEYGQWAGFHRRELFTNVRHTLALAQALAGRLDGRPLPEGLAIAVRPVDPYVELKAYQGSRRVPLE